MSIQVSKLLTFAISTVISLNMSLGLTAYNLMSILMATHVLYNIIYKKELLIAFLALHFLSR